MIMGRRGLMKRTREKGGKEFRKKGKEKKEEEENERAKGRKESVWMCRKKLKRKKGRKRGINRKRKTQLGERKGEKLERG